MITSLLTINILLLMVLPIINWALSLLFTQVKLLRTLQVFIEILLTVVTLLALTANLLNFHLIIERVQYTLLLDFSPIIYAPYLFCLAIIQMFYARQKYKISYIFTTNLITLGLTLLAFYILPNIILYIVPILLYYGMHNFVLTIYEILYWDHDKIMGFLRKQTWITKIGLLESMLPTKNRNAYILSSTASFCYSSLNLCVLLSYKTMTILDYIALGFVCMILTFSGLITFALLVKDNEMGNVSFPGCLLFHYIIQTYERIKNVISGNVDLKPKFTLRTLFFAIIVIINSLGSTAFAIPSEIPTEQPSSPVGEGQRFSRGVQAAGQTMSWVGSEMVQGATEIPRNTTSSIGSLGTAVVGAGLYGVAATYFESGQEGGSPEQELETLRVELAEKDARIAQLEKALEDQKNNSFFNSNDFYTVFKKLNNII